MKRIAVVTQWNWHGFDFANSAQPLDDRADRQFIRITSHDNNAATSDDAPHLSKTGA